MPKRRTRLRSSLLRQSRSAPRSGIRLVSYVRSSHSFARPSLASRHILSALTVARAMCAAAAAVDAAAAMPPRQAAAAGAEPAPRRARPFELDQLHSAAFHTGFVLSAIAARRAGMRRRVTSEWRGAAAKEDPAGAADPRRRPPLQRLRPTVPVAPTGLLCRACVPRSSCNLATYIYHVAVHACRRTCGIQHRAPCLDATHDSLCIARGMPDARPRTYGSCPCCALHDRCRWSAGALR